MKTLITVLCCLCFTGACRASDPKAEAEAAWAFADAQHRAKSKPVVTTPAPAPPVIYYQPTRGSFSPAYYQPYMEVGMFGGTCVGAR